MKKPLNCIIIKPSGAACNLNCTYCFYLDKQELYPNVKNPKMDVAILENVISQVMKQSGKELTIVWQGGEPTLMGLDFFEKVVEFETKYGNGKIVGNGFQTNGYLLDEDWANFLSKYSFLVGLSLDGTKHIHDHYRKNKASVGTWDKVYANALMLRSKGVEFNILTTVTDYSAKYPDEIYSFFKQNGFNWLQFAPVVETDKNDITKAASYSLSAQDWGIFMCRIFDLWFNDFTTIGASSIRFIENVFHRYMGLRAPECTMMKTCGEYLVVEHNGNVYCCDFFVTEATCLGNIHDSRLIDMLNSEKQYQFGQAKANINEKCKSCRWLNICNGGCPKDRLRDLSDKNHNHFCQSMQMFLSYTDSRFRMIAENYKKADAPKPDKTFDASGYFKL